MIASAEHARRAMDQGVKIDAVRSYSTGVVGRSLNSARTNHFVLDSSSGPNEALNSAEAFLAGISSCGVNLIELHARDTGVPLRGIQVAIEGTRSAASPATFQAITMRFELHGVDQAQADALVATYRNR
jgi:uncharacterized OsmC-like protein